MTLIKSEETCFKFGTTELKSQPLLIIPILESLLFFVSNPFGYKIND